MALVKALEFEKNGDKHEVFNLRDIADEARQIVAEAFRQKQKILEEAEAEVSRRFEQAQKDGYARGFEDGAGEGRRQGHEKALAEARKEFAGKSEKTMTALRQVLHDFQRCKDAVAWQAEQDTVVLVLAIAEKVIKKAIETDSDIVLQNIREALEFVSPHTRVIIKMSPMELDHVESMAGKSDSVFGQFSSLKFEPDPDISPGGCLVTTEQGTIDARIETHIERIAAELVMTGDDTQQTGADKEGE